VITCAICGWCLDLAAEFRRHRETCPSKESPMPEPEKYTPAVGDEVEVVLRGTVARAGMTWFAIADTNAIDADDPYVISVTKVTPPLPTTPGSVIRGGTDTALLTKTGWVNQFRDGVDPRPGWWTLIYDAGAK
jgi:hypothetical protein